MTADISSLLFWKTKSLRETSADAILIASVPVETYSSKFMNSVSMNLKIRINYMMKNSSTLTLKAIWKS
jgi:hypothetical protein